ncbi:MAG: hypothetical protein HY332_18755 [Chloroflexi bacterium]|nr:hypothetical protein [Chloroflexota bacterium]
MVTDIRENVRHDAHLGRLRRTTLRSDSATTHVLTAGEPVAVPDTLTPIRFGSYAELAKHGIRAPFIYPLRRNPGAARDARPRAARAAMGMENLPGAGSRYWFELPAASSA